MHAQLFNELMVSGIALMPAALGLTCTLAAVPSDQREAHRLHFTPQDLLTQRVFQVVVGQGQGG